MRRVNNGGLSVFAVWTTAVILIWIAMPACSQPTDPEKKEIVYRMYSGYAAKFPTVGDISPKSAMASVKTKKIVFVDVRETRETDVSMLPGAITENDFLKDPGTYKDHTVITYCTIGYRSGKLSEKLSKQGITSYNLMGGILAWVLEGGKVFDANGETNRIHVYGRKWDYTATGYVSIR